MEEVLATGLPPLFLVDEEYRLAVQEAELRFVDDLIARITDPQARMGGSVGGPSGCGPFTTGRKDKCQQLGERWSSVRGSLDRLLLWLLQKAGIDPVLFEARPSDANGVGAFLTVASNGVDGLDIIGAREVLAPGFATPFIGLRSGSGKFLGRTRTGLEPARWARQHDDHPLKNLYRGMHRVAAGRGYSRRPSTVACGTRRRVRWGDTSTLR